MTTHDDDLARRLREMDAPEPPADLRGRLLAEAPAHLSLPAPARRSQARKGLAAAASLLLSVRTGLALAASLVLAVLLARESGRQAPTRPEVPAAVPTEPAAAREPAAAGTTTATPPPEPETKDERAPAPPDPAVTSPAPAPSPADLAGVSESENPKQGEILAMAQSDETLSANTGTYDPRGRRDPMESIWDKKKRVGDRPTGIRGMEISEVDLQGIVVSPDGKEKFAIVMGTDNKGYNLREGDELFNGKVKTIEKDRVTFLQKVNDPLSIKEYTEIVKKLNPEER